MKTTAIAPSNIAFVKYWGKKDEVLRLPENGSISMNLSGLQTITTIEFDASLSGDTSIIDGLTDSKAQARVTDFLDVVRRKSGIKHFAKVVSKNSFPTGTGLSSSASGFAALALAASVSAGMELTTKEVSMLARIGSGSACRSVPDGFCEWLDGTTDDTSYAVSLHDPDWWDIVDIVAVVSTAKKDVPTTDGQKLTQSSPFFQIRLADMKNKISHVKKYISQRDFTPFGELIEAEALNMHAVMMTSKPALLYLTPPSLLVMKEVIGWRKTGLEAYFTVNTGQDIHILCWRKDADAVSSKLKALGFVRTILVNKPAKGVSLSSGHLF